MNYMIGIKMNIEICKKCQNYPKFYLYMPDGKDKIGLLGYQEIKNDSTRLSCIVSYNGIKQDKNIANWIKKHSMPTVKIENFLKDRRVIPNKTVCPYYTEHLMSEWNKNEQKGL